MKKGLSLLLALVLLLTLFPTAALAADANPFKDIHTGDYYYDSVIWAYYHDPQITNGTSSTTFSPDSTVTRSEAVTFLWRARGCPEPARTSSGFSDVESGSWYEKAVIWATEQGITNGTGNQKFTPWGTLTRNQLITLIWRTLGEPNKTGTGTWYADAENWAKEEDLLDNAGKPYASEDYCPRCDVVLYLYRVLELSYNMDGENELIGPATDAALPNSTSVTEEDVIALTVDTVDLMARETKTLHFSLSSSLIVPAFSLRCNGEDTGATLTDPDQDGVYTGSFAAGADSDTELVFTAQASVGGSLAVSNPVTVTVTEPISDETIETVENVTDSISYILRGVNAQLTEDMEEEEKAELRMGAVWDYLAQLQRYAASGSGADQVNNPVSGQTWTPRPDSITGLRMGSEETGDPFTLYYKIDGLDLGVACMERGAEDSEGPGAASTAGAPALTDQTAPHKGASNYMTDAESAIVLCYYKKNSGENISNSAVACETALRDIGYRVTSVYNQTFEDYKDLENYALVIVRSHGYYYNGVPVICTDQKLTTENLEQYRAEIKNRWVYVCTYDDGTYYDIPPAFFEHYYTDAGKPLSARWFHLGLCLGCKNEKLAETILNAGADTVTGFTDTVFTTYSASVIQEMLSVLQGGGTVRQGVDTAKQKYGDDDEIWGANNNKLPDYTPAEPVIYGDEAMTLHSQLRNGDFEKNFTFSLGSWGTLRFPWPWSSWSWSGAAKPVTRMNNVTAPNGKYMAFVCTGKGALHDETFSCFYQPILIPEDATYLSFKWNIYTEEYARNGGGCNDLVKVDLLDNNGHVQKNLLRFDVLTPLKPMFESSVPSNGNTAYYTYWYKHTSNISAYRGKLVTLCFWVQDKGDSAYDTFAMIDDIQIW